ncbi:MAG: hypothetical protein JW991_02300 [Candidatus Pacebacteria bacterium]|nr:hypothetical protein [Candidatus Paceibacterota bacterium]
MGDGELGAEKPSVGEQRLGLGVVNKLADRYFIRGRQPECLSVTRVFEYRQMLPEIQRCYAGAGSWHGTGRFQYRDGERVDILEGILVNKGLAPQQDSWDPQTGTVHRISTAPSRMYARLYAGMHFHEGQGLVNPCGDTKLWVDFFIGSLTLEVIREFGSIGNLLRSKGSSRKFWSELEKKHNFSLAENVEKWRGKVTQKKIPVTRVFMAGSDISGNYPILIGIRKGSVVPAEASRSIQKHEVRVAEAISLDEFTHLEVPLKNVVETLAFLQDRGRGDVPVIPLEFGEEYSRGLPFSALVRGGVMEPGDQVGREVAREVVFPQSESIPNAGSLAQFAPQVGWFPSPERAFDWVHGIGHHARVLVLQEVRAQSLIESGAVPADIDREALRWTAVTHDARRRSNLRSLDHGVEAAAWVDAVLPSDLPAETCQKIKLILAHHDDEDGNLAQQLPELAILGDADKLERCRLEHLLPPRTPAKLRRRVGLDPTYLHYSDSILFAPLAEALFLLSRQNQKRYQRNPFQSVMDAALVLGVVK